MAINLLDLVKAAACSQLGPLSIILDESEQQTNSAVNRAIPVILDGLVKKAATDDGAKEIFNSLDEYDGGILENLGGMLGGGNHTRLLEKGPILLDMILGNNRALLVSAIAKMAGVADSKVNTMLGILAPIVMGVLGKERRDQNLDFGGLTDLLSSQSEHLVGQVPTEISSSLEPSQIYGVDPRKNADVTTTAETQSQAAATTISDSVGNGGGLVRTLLPLILLGAIAFIGSRFLLDRNKPIPQINIPGFDTVGITQAFDRLTDAIDEIKDEASARLVVPKIQEVESLIGTIDLGSIATGSEKDAASRLFGDVIKKLKTALDSAYAIPGVREILAPVVDPLLSKFKVFGLPVAEDS